MAQVPAEHKGAVAAQLAMQKESELINLITNQLKKLHDNKMAVLNNMR